MKRGQLTETTLPRYRALMLCGLCLGVLSLSACGGQKSAAPQATASESAKVQNPAGAVSEFAESSEDNGDDGADSGDSDEFSQTDAGDASDSDGAYSDDGGSEIEHASDDSGDTGDAGADGGPAPDQDQQENS